MKNLAAVITILLVGIITACGPEDAADFAPKATSPSPEEIRRMVQVALDKQAGQGKQETPATRPPAGNTTEPPYRRQATGPSSAGTTGYQTEEALAEARTRCLHWATDNLNAIQYRKLEQADPQNLTDLERALWRQTLNGGPWRYYPNEPEVARVEHGGNIHCRIYWAEPVSKRNAAKRNEAFRYQCEQWLEQAVRGDYNRIEQQMNQRIGNSKEPAPIPNQYARLRQWLAMSGAELLNAPDPPYAALKAVSRHEYAHRSSPSDITPEADREWRKRYKDEYRPELARTLRLFGMSTGSNSESIRCRLYYPQLFYGHWIPIEESDEDYRNLMVPADMEAQLPPPGEHGVLHIGDIDETPVYLPDTVTRNHVLPGYPIGKGNDEEYRICREGSDTETAGYQYVPHPSGHYCEPDR